jgi:hypothetical protein
LKSKSEITAKESKERQPMLDKQADKEKNKVKSNKKCQDY